MIISNYTNSLIQENLLGGLTANQESEPQYLEKTNSLQTTLPLQNKMIVNYNSKQPQLSNLSKPHIKPKSKRVQCKICNKILCSNSYLRQHLKIHTGEKFICNDCHKSFTRQYALRKHINVVHLGLKPLTLVEKLCKWCQKPFTSNYLRKHERIHTVDADGKLFLCNYCNIPYKNIITLSKHIRESH